MLLVAIAKLRQVGDDILKLVDYTQKLVVFLLLGAWRTFSLLKKTYSMIMRMNLKKVVFLKLGIRSPTWSSNVR
jgi:hypothetical protein